jgi:hypothetical protein
MRRRSHHDLLLSSPTARGRWRISVCRDCVILGMCILMSATLWWQVWGHWTLERSGTIQLHLHMVRLHSAQRLLLPYCVGEPHLLIRTMVFNVYQGLSIFI